MSKIIFEYYLNFVPYFANLFSALFVFISVIFFTSKLSSNSEIIAMLSSGISFRRLLVPYFISAFIIAVFSYILSNFVIPPANQTRIDFENKYLKNKYQNHDMNIHKQISPGLYVYVERYHNDGNVGNRFSIERIEDMKLVSKTNALNITWDTVAKKWVMDVYYTRNLNGMEEDLIKGAKLDTLLNLSPQDFINRDNTKETMDYWQLNEHIEKLKLEGSDLVANYVIEKHKRLSMPFAAFILALIGVAVSSRKVRGGIGLHLGIGLGLSFSYIMFMQISTNMATSGAMDPLIAVWMPNVVFSLIAFYMYKRAPK